MEMLNFFEAQSESCSLLICSTFVGIPEPIILWLKLDCIVAKNPDKYTQAM